MKALKAGVNTLPTKECNVQLLKNGEKEGFIDSNLSSLRMDGVLNNIEKDLADAGIKQELNPNIPLKLRG